MYIINKLISKKKKKAPNYVRPSEKLKLQTHVELQQKIILKNDKTFVSIF